MQENLVLMEHLDRLEVPDYKVRLDRWANKGLRVGQGSRARQESQVAQETRDLQGSPEHQDQLDHLDYK